LFTSEDSKFCATCGKEFHQSRSENSPIKTVHFKNDIDTPNDKIVNSSGKNTSGKKQSLLTLIAIIAGVALGIVIISGMVYYPTTTTSPSIEASNSSAENITDPGAAVTMYAANFN
jgi:uncharacterized membrane protein YvbJ